MRNISEIYGTNKLLVSCSLIVWILYAALTAPICFNPIISYMLAFGYVFILLANRVLLNKNLLYICLYWIIINILCFILKSHTFNLNNVIGALTPILIAFGVLIVCGANFWEKLEKIVFYFTLISLLIFILQVCTGSLFDNFSSIFGRYIADVYKETRPTAWYAFIYTYSPIDGLSFPRNSGFMWEPGAYAMVVSVFLGYRFLKYGVRLCGHNLIYILALISTFSTAGYLMLIMFFIMYIVETRNILLAIPLVVILSVLIPYIFSLDFVGAKLTSYSEGMGQSFTNDRLGLYEYNRFETFVINMRRLLEFPIGYGVNQITDRFNNYFVGVNGIAVFARSWGIIGLVIALKSIVSTLRMWCNKAQLKNPNICILLVFLIFMVTFFSNPIERSVLFITIILYPFIYKFSRDVNK